MVSEFALTRRAPWRAAVRVLLLAALMFLACAVPYRAVAQAPAQPVRGEANAVFENGFVRIVLTLSDDVESQVRTAGNIIIVAFQRPVVMSLDKLVPGSDGFTSAARRDPDGRGLRIALAKKAKVSSMVAAERLFIDLLPETWSGLPPGLPREVIEELSQRAREADKKLRQQRALVRTNKMTPIRVRVARQPTFTRYVFELPTMIGVVVNNDKAKLTLTFDALLKFDLADAKATLPPVIGAIDTDIEQDAATVRFSFAGPVDVRTFRENLTYIVDVTSMEAKDSQPESKPRSDELSEMAADLAARTRAPPAVEAPQTVPARPTPSAGAEPARAPAAPGPAPAPAPPQSATDRPVREAPGQAPPAAAPREPRAAAPVEAAPPPAVVPAPPQLDAARAAASKDNEKEPAARESAARENAAKAHATNESATKESPANEHATLANAAKEDVVSEPAAAPAPEPVSAVDGGRPQVKVVLKHNGDHLSLTFPFTSVTPAAVFSRADTLWLVFDSDLPIDLGKLDGEPTRTVKSASVSQQGDVAVVRIKLERPRLVSATADRGAWTITIAGEVVEPTRPVAINRNVVGAGGASVTIPFDEPHRLHRLDDPEAGDGLLVVTGTRPARGFLKSQDFVEFRALASTHGVVMQPIADDLTVEISSDKIVVSRPGGLSLSAATRARSGERFGYLAPVFDAQTWGFDRQADFAERSMQLIRTAAEAPGAKRSAARADLARFYLARDMGVEAKGVLDVALADNTLNTEDSALLVLRALANMRMGRLEAALRDLGHPSIGSQHEAPVWRAMIYARQGRWAEARDGFRTASMGGLPLEMQRMMLKDMVRASLGVGDVAGAASQIVEFEAIGVPHELEPTLAVLNGQIAEGLGRMSDALRAYEAAADSWDRPAAAQGRLRQLVLQTSLGKLKRSDAIEALETLTAVWRGDETEVEGLHLLSRLYTEDNRYRDAFQIMRTALAAHPNSEMTRRIHDEAAATFDNLFLAGRGDVLPPIDALALFYDFRDLTPIGRRGDEMIRRLADRLVSVDLLDQATELLQHQVDHRLQGAARAQVAARLAFIYLMNRKPDRALAALRATRSPDFSSDLRNQRLLLEARALSDLGRHDVAFEVVADIPGPEAIRLRADVMWAGKRWREAAEQIELLYGERWHEFEPLNDDERRDILRAGVGYVLGDDAIGSERLREKYASKMGDGPDKRAFDVVTAPVNPNGSEFREIARSLAAVDPLLAFLRDMRARYPEVGTASPVPTRAPAAPPVSQRGDPPSTGTLPPRAPEASPLPPIPPALRRTAAR